MSPMIPTDHLSTYFTYGEAVGSATADRRKIDNTPDDATLARIILTARKLDSVRRFLGVPMHITSWYRSPELNKAIGSKPTSQHILGEAVDFVAPQRGTPSQVAADILNGGLHYDQLILEYPGSSSGGWVHISFADNPRQQALLIDANGTTALA